ncbi:MAG: citrate/2-methylcitrate synthase [Deferrisomatales bacterium]|nr:citrate/2-methylcitrate synthase [Deferrisomatales bacterium]
MSHSVKTVESVILDAARKARQEADAEPEPELVKPAEWPIVCTVGPGLEGAIACESKVGYVNGAKGWLIYRGYDVFDLCAHSTYEEVCYLLLHGKLPSASEYAEFRETLAEYRHLPSTLRLLLGFPVERMSTMAALRLGVNMMRQELTHMDDKAWHPAGMSVIGSDEDSIPMETAPRGDKHAIYEFKRRRRLRAPPAKNGDEGSGLGACYHLIAGLSTVAAAIARVHQGRLPIEPDPELGHAANFLYMMTGRRPSPVEEKVMDVALILHADHGMNASTFAAMVVASTLSDFYFSVGSGIAALNGPLHGGANEQVVQTLEEVRRAGDVGEWVNKAVAAKRKIPGFGHRVYKAYDPRARVLGPLAELLAGEGGETRELFDVARRLEERAVERLGQSKQIFPNVDFYSGLVYRALGIPTEMFTPIFAVSRVAGWTARILEYLENNRIFRPRARYVGEFGKEYVPLAGRGGER